MWIFAGLNYRLCMLTVLYFSASSAFSLSIYLYLVKFDLLSYRGPILGNQLTKNSLDSSKKNSPNQRTSFVNLVNFWWNKFSKIGSAKTRRLLCAYHSPLLILKLLNITHFAAQPLLLNQFTQILQATSYLKQDNIYLRSIRPLSHWRNIFDAWRLWSPN